MTDLEMTKHLLAKTGRRYDENTYENGTVLQIWCFDGRLQLDFDAFGNLEEDWDNTSVSTWLSGGYYYD